MMNRIHAEPTYQDIAVPSEIRAVGSSVYTPSVRGTECALFAPLHYERNYAYPLIVWLHGPGADESQLKRIMPHISTRNYAAVAPRGTAEHRTHEKGGARFTWLQTDGHLHLAEQRIFTAVEIATRKLNIAPHRVFLAGFDAGGTMAYRVAMNHPRQFAGVLAVGATFPSGGAPLSRLSEARRLPLFLAHGRDSTECPAELICADLRLFHSAGLDVTLRQYPCGHLLDPMILSDMDRWMMEQVTGESHC